MQIDTYEIDKQLLFADLEQIISDELPESLSSWQMTGEDVIDSLLESESNHIKTGKVSHVPSIAPEMKDIITWVPVILGCVNTLFQIMKEKKVLAKETLLLQKEETTSTSDLNAEQLDTIEQILRNELIIAGLSKSKTEKISARLAKTVVQILK